MIASIILSFSVVAIASAMVAVTQQSVATNAKSAALAAARADMETLAAYPLSQMYSVNGGATQTLDPSTFLTQTGLTSSGQVSFVNRSSGQGTWDLAVVQVTVTSADGPTVTLSRLISKEGNGQ